MTIGLDLAAVAALVGDPARANMLAALLDGRALTASELAAVAGITPQTASGHLGKLTQGHLIESVAQGRHRYFRLASPHVARMLEAILVVAGEPRPQKARAVPRIDPALCTARSCYDHLAGRLGVALADALVGRSLLILTRDAGEITERGRAFLESFGVPVVASPGSRRPSCRPCLDWSERRPHLAGVVGAALFQRLGDLGWVARGESRAVRITQAGRSGFREVFGIEGF